MYYTHTHTIIATSLLQYKRGAKFCHQNKLGHFPIHAAAFSGAKKSMEVILLKGEMLYHWTWNIILHSTYKSTVLYFSFFTGEEVGLSIDSHINYVDKSCSSPLHLAVRGGNLDIIKLCIAYGAKIDQQQVKEGSCHANEYQERINSLFSFVSYFSLYSVINPLLSTLHVVKVPLRLWKSCSRLTIKCVTLSTSLMGPTRHLYISTSALHAKQD